MLVWRISKYADLSGRGGLAASGRWHTRPQSVVYTSEEPFTAYLEVLRNVNGEAALLPDDYQVLKIHVPDGIRIEAVDVEALDAQWSERRSGWPVCQRIGDEWLQRRETSLLRVPSAARSGFSNILINRVHRETDDIRVLEAIPQPFPSFVIEASV